MHAKQWTLFFILFLLFSFSLIASAVNHQGEALLSWKQSLNLSAQELNNWDSNDETPCEWFGITCNFKQEVVEMELRYVELWGKIPTNFSSLLTLNKLILVGTNLTGSIPKGIGDLRELNTLDLSGNGLTGEIPIEICGLLKLEKVDLSSNRLVGSIPAGIGNLTILKELGIHDNQLSGQIPRSIGNMTLLTVIRAGGNRDIEDSNRTLFLCEDILEMESAAQKFEKECGILDEIQGQAYNAEELYSYPLLNLLKRADADGYSPYCKIEVQLNSEFTAAAAAICRLGENECVSNSQPTLSCITENHKPEPSDPSLSCEASTLCSVVDYTETFSTTSHVQRNSSFEQSSEISNRALESSRNNCSSTSPGNIRPSELTTLDQESDDSDAEIFRVKRRPLKLDKKTGSEATSLKHFASQDGRKRLKRLQTNGNSEQLTPSDYRGTDKSRYKFYPSTAHKDSAETDAIDKSSRGSTMPIAIKYKRFSNEKLTNSNRQRVYELDNHRRRERFQHEMGKPKRLPPSMEIGPKRLKIRGAQHLSGPIADRIETNSLNGSQWA